MPHKTAGDLMQEQIERYVRLKDKIATNTANNKRQYRKFQIIVDDGLKIRNIYGLLPYRRWTGIETGYMWDERLEHICLPDVPLLEYGGYKMLPVEFAATVFPGEEVTMRVDLKTGHYWIDRDPMLLAILDAA